MQMVSAMTDAELDSISFGWAPNGVLVDPKARVLLQSAPGSPTEGYQPADILAHYRSVLPGGRVRHFYDVRWVTPVHDGGECSVSQSTEEATLVHALDLYAWYKRTGHQLGFLSKNRHVRGAGARPSMQVCLS